MFQFDFDTYVSPGDSITCNVDGFDCVATLHFDPDTEAPADLPADALDAWRRDDWHYYGVVVNVYRVGVKLTIDYVHALWGIDGNFPNGLENPNWYFRAVANDLLPEAITAAKAKIKELNANCLLTSQ
jgi:hypothetical protein